MARIPNPYIVGTPIPGPDFFFGRESLLSFVRDTLNPPQQRVVVLYGQRRIGKTSVLYELARRLADEYHPVYFDLMGQANRPLTLALYEIAHHIADSLAIKPPENFVDPLQFRTFLTAACEQRTDEKPILLLLDEFDDLSDADVSADAAALNLFDYLRDLLNIQLPVAFVFVVGRRLTELPQNFQSILKQAPSRRVAFLKEEDTRTLITRSAAGTLTYTPESIAAIYRLTFGHPYCTQLICFELFRLAMNREDTAVTAQDVNTVLESAIETGKGGLAWFWDALPLAERFIMSAIAEASRDSQTATTNAVREVIHDLQLGFMGMEVTSAPDLLVQWQILRVTNEGYQFTVELVRRWILLEHPLSQARREVENVSPRANRYFANAREAHQSGDISLAIEDYLRALGANPNHFRAQLGLAQALEEKGQLLEAHQAYQRAFELDQASARDSLASSYDKLAANAEQQGELAEALIKLEKAEAIHRSGTRTIRIQEIRERIAQKEQERNQRLRRLRTMFAYAAGVILLGVASFYTVTRFFPMGNNDLDLPTAIPGQPLILITRFNGSTELGLNPELNLQLELSNAFPAYDFQLIDQSIYAADKAAEAASGLINETGATAVIGGWVAVDSISAEIYFQVGEDANFFTFDPEQTYAVSQERALTTQDISIFSQQIAAEFETNGYTQMVDAFNEHPKEALYWFGRLILFLVEDVDWAAALFSQAIDDGFFEPVTMQTNQGIDIVFVPSGDFEMGREADLMLELCLAYKNDCNQHDFAASEPVRTVYTNFFFIDAFEVTNDRYQECVAAAQCRPPGDVGSSTRSDYYTGATYESYPVVNVSWDQANAYCGWINGRLPTAAEWEKAARWDPVNGSLAYPWGDVDPNPNLANFARNNTDTVMIGRYEPGPSGSYDMAGNVWEWVQDWYQIDYYQIGDSDNPQGPDFSESGQRVFRGGAHYSPDFGMSVIDPAYHTGHDPGGNVVTGFRCAYDNPFTIHQE